MSLITNGHALLTSALDTFEVSYRKQGVSANIEKWAKNKLPLIVALRQHPNWNEDALAVVMKVTERRGDDKSAANSAIRRIENYVRYDKSLPELQSTIANLQDHLYTKHITQECVDAAKSLETPSLIQPSVGMKTSRFIRKLCEAHGVDVDGDVRFRTLFASYADTISPYDVVRPYVFSVNPADFALMSNGNSWSSCHGIAPNKMSGGYSGEYRAGCFSYMNDGATVVSYTVETLPEDMKTLCLMPKYCRQLYYIADDGKMFIQSRSYPYVSQETRRDMRRVAHSILSTVYGFDNLWGPPKNNGSQYAIQEDARHYPDYRHFREETKLSYTSEVKVALANGEERESIFIGESPDCLLCGGQKMHSSGSLYCYQCDPHDDHDDDNYDEDDLTV